MPMIQNKAKCKSSLFHGECDDSSTYNGFNRSELSSLLVVDVVLLTFSNIDYCPKPLKGFYKQCANVGHDWRRNWWSLDTTELK